MRQLLKEMYAFVINDVKYYGSLTFKKTKVEYSV